MQYLYQNGVIGGTFDLAHIGHKSLITQAFKLAKFVTIGITTDEFNEKRQKQVFENQDIRTENLQRFLKKNNLLTRSKIILLNNIFGPTTDNPEMDAIIVTKDTLSNASLINKERGKKGFKKLKVIISPYEKDVTGKIISSSRIRSGQIDFEGKIYKQLLLKIADKTLNNQIRHKLKKPLGILSQTIPVFDTDIFTVGDITTQKALKRNINPKLSIVDFRVQRHHIFKDLSQLGFSQNTSFKKVCNPPGQISKALICQIEKAIKDPFLNQVIFVKGEEDLAVIPAVLMSPYNTSVLYGQPNEGLVTIKVNAEIKNKLCKILGI